MKGIISILLALLPLAVNAQQTEEDAFYIYRNDGGFNGFFFSEVERMEFSKVDTLGVTHFDYVVQEIQTADSLYRIPISAIDSVSFVTPKTVYKKDVAATTESQLWDYVVGSDSISRLLLSSNMPASLMPNVGDKLVTTKSRAYLPGGFYGVVSSVKNTANGTEILCKSASLTEFFDRHIFKGGMELTAPGVASSRRAGESGNTYHEELEPIEGEIELEKEWELVDNWKFTGTGTIGAKITPDVYIHAFGSVDPAAGLNTDMSLHLKADSELDLSIKGVLEGSIDYELAQSRKWIPDTPFFIVTKGGINNTISGEMEFKYHFENTSTIIGAAQFNEGLFYNNMMTHMEYKNMGSKQEFECTGTVTAKVGPYFTLALVIAHEDLAKLEARVDAGLQAIISAQIKKSDWDLVFGDESNTALYDALNRDGSVKTGLFGTGVLNVGFMKEEEKLADLFELERGFDFEGGLVPKFETPTAYYSSESKTLSVFGKAKRKVLTPVSLGFAIYDMDGKQVGNIEWAEDHYTDPGDRDYFTFNKEISNIPVGWYNIHPVVNQFTKDMLAKPAYKFYAGERTLKVTPDSLGFDYQGGTGRVKVENTLSPNAFSINIIDVANWVSYDRDGEELVVTVKPNETTQRRRTTVNVIASEPNTWNSITRSITITQDIDPSLIGLLPTEIKSSSICSDYAPDDHDAYYVDMYSTTNRETDWGPAGTTVCFAKFPIDRNSNDVKEMFQKAVLKYKEDGSFSADVDGLAITGQFEPRKKGEPWLKGSGTFTINSAKPDHRKTAEEYSAMWRTSKAFYNDILETYNPTLDATMTRRMDGTFTVVYNESTKRYEFTYTGTGTYRYDAICADFISGLNFNLVGWEQGPAPNATVTRTTNKVVSGDSELNYSVTYELVE